MLKRVRYIGAAIAIIASGYAFIAFAALESDIETVAQGWHLFQLPNHPILELSALLLGAVSLMLASAFLLPAHTFVQTSGTSSTHAIARGFLIRVGLCAAATLIAAGLLAYIVMAIGDS